MNVLGTTRDEHLAWCKERALAELEMFGGAAALASMISDLGKWEGGALYDEDTFVWKMKDGLRFCMFDHDMREWINSFT